MNLNSSPLPPEGDDEKNSPHGDIHHMSDAAMDVTRGGIPEPMPPRMHAPTGMSVDEIQRKKQELLAQIRALEEQERAAGLAGGMRSGLPVEGDPLNADGGVMPREPGAPDHETVVEHYDPWRPEQEFADPHEASSDPQHLPNLEELVSELTVSGKGEKLDDVLNTDSSFPRHLVLAFARNTNKALMDFMQSLYAKRLAAYMRRSGLKDEEIAQRQKYISAEEMRHRIVNRFAQQLFRKYLTDEAIAIGMGQLTASIEEALGVEAPKSFSQKPTSNEMMAELYRLLTKIVYQVTSDIVADEAGKKSEETGEYISPEEYASIYVGRELSNLLLDINRQTALEMKHMITTEADKESYIDGRFIRHTALNILQVMTSKHQLAAEGVSPEELSKFGEAPPPDVIDAEIAKAFAQCEFENAVIQHGQRGVAVHRKLEGRDHDFIRNPNLTVRLAGYDATGNPTSLEDDFELFEKLEKQLLEWKQPFIDQPNSAKLTKEQRHAIERFHKEGGHVGPMSRDAMEFIRQHGIILFIERKIREDLSITLGSISALSRTPSSRPPEGINLQAPENWQFNERALQLFPQYNIGDLVWPQNARPQEQKDLYNTTEKRILICRSSILAALTPEIWEDQWEKKDVDYDEIADELNKLKNQPLRRLGLAGRLKAGVFGVAKRMHSKYLTFNIGTLMEPGGEGLERANKPSREHNKWVRFLSWRNKTDEIGSGVEMWWAAFSGEIEHGLEEFYRPHGLVRGKDWDIEGIEKTSDKHHGLLEKEIQNEQHFPW